MVRSAFQPVQSERAGQNARNTAKEQPSKYAQIDLAAHRIDGHGCDFYNRSKCQRRTDGGRGRDAEQQDSSGVVIVPAPTPVSEMARAIAKPRAISNLVSLIAGRDMNAALELSPRPAA